MTRFALLACVLLLPGPLGAQAVPPAVDITAEEVRDFIDALPDDRVSDRPIRVVDVGGYRVGVYGVFRPVSATPQRAIVHHTSVTEIYYVLVGAGTLVTGGRLSDPTPVPGSSFGSEYAPRIVGGHSRRIAEGDVVVIPGGTPHSWSSLEEDVTYLIFRPDPESIQELR